MNNPRPGRFMDCPACGHTHYELEQPMRSKPFIDADRPPAEDADAPAEVLGQLPRPTAYPPLTAEELRGPNADMRAHLDGGCNSRSCLFCLAAAHTHGNCEDDCRWCAAAKRNALTEAVGVQAGELQAAVAAVQGCGPLPQISLRIWVHASGPEVDWTIWDGHKHHAGKSLAAALATFLASKAPEQTIAQVEEVLAAA